MKVLGIETSCDETSVAILEDEKVLVNLIYSQDFHKIYGGVVPELSSRAHLQTIKPLLTEALKSTNLNLSDIDVIGATAGPGLIGALLVGLTFAKGLAFSLQKPFIPVNHIEGHIFSSFLMSPQPEFPVLTLVVSGGHTMLLLVESHYKIIKLGSTIDDAAGEAFDKVAKLLGLGYPGGPKLSRAAQNGNKFAIKFPIAKLPNPYNFSYSGIKTSVLYYVRDNFPATPIPDNDLYDICASFEYTIVKSLTKKIELASKEFKFNSIAVVGGVAANSLLRQEIRTIAENLNKQYVFPDLSYCGDNAAMIAYRAYNIYKEGKTFSLNYKAFPSFFSDYFIDYIK
jgi:N6-L-threonylcarbamoyladenine synthase